MDLRIGVLTSNGFIIESWFFVIGSGMFQNAHLYFPPSGLYLGIILLIGIILVFIVFIIELFDFSIKSGKINLILGISSGILILIPVLTIMIIGFFDINIIFNMFFNFPFDIRDFNFLGIGFYGTGSGILNFFGIDFEFSATWWIFIGQIIGIIVGFILIYHVYTFKKKVPSI